MPDYDTTDGAQAQTPFPLPDVSKLPKLQMPEPAPFYKPPYPPFIPIPEFKTTPPDPGQPFMPPFKPEQPPGIKPTLPPDDGPAPPNLKDPPPAPGKTPSNDDGVFGTLKKLFTGNLPIGPDWKLGAKPEGGPSSDKNMDKKYVEEQKQREEQNRNPGVAPAPPPPSPSPWEGMF